MDENEAGTDTEGGDRQDEGATNPTTDGDVADVPAAGDSAPLQSILDILQQLKASIEKARDEGQGAEDMGGDAEIPNLLQSLEGSLKAAAEALAEKGG